jgi:hypothetical protein
LIGSMISVAWPLQPPFVSDIYVLLDRLVAEEKAKDKGKVTEETQVVVEKKPVKVTQEVEETQVKVVRKKRPRKS